MEFNATFLATIISFIAFVFLMNKILYAPILNIMESRKAFINENYNVAKNNEDKIQKLNQKRDEKLLEAREEARESFAETLEEYKSQRDEIVDIANEEAKNELEKSRLELNDLSNEVKEGLKHSMSDLANDIIEKVIGYRSEVQDFDNKTVDEILYN